MKDIKHIRRDFDLVAWVMPKGSDLGYQLGLGGQKKISSEIQPDLVCQLLTSMAYATVHFFSPHPLGPWGEAKRSNIIKSPPQSQFQRFLNQTLCVLSQMKDIKHIRQDFHSVAWVMPQGSDLGVQWGGWVVQIFFFRNSTKFGV